MASVVGLTRVWATGPQTPNIDPGTSKWARGWVAEIPTLQVLNFINNRNDTNQLALAERGVFQWVAQITYKLGALVWDETNSTIYKSKVATPNKTQAPSANLAQWDPSSVQISRADYDANAANWAAHIANKANPHQLTAAQLNTYTAVEIAAKIAAVAAEVAAHVGIVAGNPHNTTAADVGSVPIAGGTYTGVVAHRYAQTLMGPTADGGSINAGASGVLLGKGKTARMGLNGVSQPVAIDEAGVVSVLLTEAEYVAQRQAEAVNYALPAPDLWLVLKNGAVLSTGTGPFTFTGPAGRSYVGKDGVAHTSELNKPMLTQEGMYVISGEDAFIGPSTDNLGGFDTWTKFLDCTIGSGNMEYQYANMPAGSCTMYLAGTDFRTSFRDSTGAYGSYSFGAFAQGDRLKACVTYDGTSLRLYTNGVLYATFVKGLQKHNSSSAGIRFATGATPGSHGFIRDFRTWNTVLTDKQIAQL